MLETNEHCGEGKNQLWVLLALLKSPSPSTAGHLAPGTRPIWYGGIYSELHPQGTVCPVILAVTLTNNDYQLSASRVYLNSNERFEGIASLKIRFQVDGGVKF